MANPSVEEVNRAESLCCKTPTSQNHQSVEDIQYIMQKREENRNSPQWGEDVKNSINRGDSCFNCKISGGSGTPDRLKVPKPFKYSERYTSPTDHMMSPVSKGLLARKSRRGGALLPPSIIQSKIQELQSPNVDQIQLHLEQ